MEQENTSKGLIIGVVVVLVLILVGAGIYFGFNRGDDTENENNDTNQELVSTDRLNVTDQFPGGIVYVSSMTLENGGFVVIHQEDENGNPGAILGEKYFSRGTQPGDVELRANTKLVEGTRYFAMLHHDIDGDKVFDSTVDLPMKDVAGNHIMVGFNVSTDLPEIKG